MRSVTAAAFVLPLLACLCLSGAPAQETRVTLPLVESFDAIEKDLPAGWTNDSAGELVASAVPEPRAPREGKGSWRLLVPVWDAGTVRFSRPGIPLRRGRTYSGEVWLRSRDLAVPVTLSLRKQGAPFTSYLSQQAAVGPEWRRIVLHGTAPEDDPDAALSLSFQGSGTLQIDALRLQEGDLPEPPAPVPGETPPPPVKGNRVFNSSFEVGADGWTQPDRLALVQETCPDGRQFARLPAGASLSLEARPFVARPGRAYSFSAFLRSSTPGARARVAAAEVGSGERAEQTFEVGPEWKRVSFTAPLRCERYNRYFLAIRAVDRPAPLDVDAVQVEEADLAPYAPAAPLEVGIALSRRALFPEPNERVTVPVRLYARGKVPADSSLQYRVEGFFGEGLALGIVNVPPGATHAEVPLQFRAPAAGTLRVTVEARVGPDTVSRAEEILTVLPPLEATPAPDSFFGGHGSLGADGEWHAPTVAARAGIRWWRLGDLTPYTSWEVAEPERDRFAWRDHDVAALRLRGLSLLGVLGRTPSWASAASGGAAGDRAAQPPAKIGDFADYVKAVLTHYRGQVAAYEIWNEPWSRNSWTGTPEQYVELAKAAARAARAADPQAALVGGSFAPAEREFTDRALAKGLLPVLDAASSHQYTGPDATVVPAGGRDAVTQWHQSLRARLKLAGGEKLPVWTTAGGVSCPSFYSWLGAQEQSRAAARALAKTLIVSRASGVRRFFYDSVWDERGIGRTFDGIYADDLALLDYDASGKPTLAVLAACAQNLEGVEPAGRVESADLRAYLFKQGPDTVIAAWSPTALEKPYDLALKIEPRRLRTFNVMGNPRGFRVREEVLVLTLRNEPVYIHLKDTSPTAAAALLKPAPRAPRKP